MIKQVEQFGKEIQAEYPNTKVSVTTYPSGALTLDIDINSISIEMAYTPSAGFGVSLVDAATPPFTGHDEVFAAFSDARERMLRLIETSVKVSS